VRQCSGIRAGEKKKPRRSTQRGKTKEDFS
jgi:hypothetical protein